MRMSPVFTKQRQSVSRKPSGFSLIELAVSLTIIALILVTLVPSVRTTIESRRVTDTRQLVENAKEALYAYAMVHGRLPCPATSSSAGEEAFAPGSTGIPPAPPIAGTTYGQCQQFDGFLPARTLGLGPAVENGLQLDAWATPSSQLRYAVARDVAINLAGVGGASYHPITTKGGVRARTMETAAGVPMLKICSPPPSAVPHALGTCASDYVTATSTPAVVYSLAANAPTAAASLSILEQENLNGDVIFMAGVARAAEPTTSSDPSGFDDIVTWLSTNTLFGRMVQAGQLP
jgi:prepilin-type N-terminal cleavage/methylation domain-containing protein